jgi:hypothetical protein
VGLLRGFPFWAFRLWRVRACYAHLPHLNNTTSTQPLLCALAAASERTRVFGSEISSSEPAAAAVPKHADPCSSRWPAMHYDCIQ